MAMIAAPTSAVRVALLVGSSTGIGAACALEFAARGWTVAITHLDEAQRPTAAEVLADCQQLGAPACMLPLDVTVDEQCRAAIACVVDRFGRLDALVNCAGTTRFIPHADLEALDAAEFQRIYGVNLVGTFQMIRASRAALAATGDGSVVNVSSIAGLNGRGSSLAYAASKAALHALTLSMARSLAPAVRVNAIAPGFVEGGLPSRVLAGPPYAALVEQQIRASALQRVAQPEEVAAMAWFLCERAPSITGEVIVMDNGLHLHAG